MPRKLFTGYVSVNDLPEWSYEGVPALFNQHGFSIPRLRADLNQIRPDGPHFQIGCPNANHIINAIGFRTSPCVKHEVTGDYIGYVDSLGGHAALDPGPGRFLIHNLLVFLELKEEVTSFQLTGAARIAPGTNLTQFGVQSPDLKFEIAFSVHDSDLATLFDSEGFAEVLLRNRNMRPLGENTP